MADEFEIDGVKFELSPLKVEQSLELLPDLFALIAPVAAAANAEDLTPEVIKGAIEGGVSGLRNLPKFTKAFASRCKVERGEGKMVAMVGQIFDQAFERKMALQLKWLVQCLKLEYADFLAAGGQLDLGSLAANLNSPTK